MNSELAKQQMMIQGRTQRLERLAQASRTRLTNLRAQDQHLQEQAHAYEQQGMELSLQVMLLETTGKTEERTYFPLKARQLAADWEMRQRKAKLEKNATRRQALLNKCGAIAKNCGMCSDGMRIWSRKHAKCMNWITQRTRS